MQVVTSSEKTKWRFETSSSLPSAMEAKKMHNGAHNTMYQCNICDKVLSIKQTLATHMQRIHNKHDGTNKRKYKQYLFDVNVPIPRTTQYRRHQSIKRLQNENDSEVDSTDSITEEKSNYNAKDFEHEQNERVACNEHLSSPVRDEVMPCAQDIQSNDLPEQIESVTCSDSDDESVNSVSDIADWTDSDESDIHYNNMKEPGRQKVISDHDEKCMVLLSCLMKCNVSGQAFDNILKAYNLLSNDGLNLTQTKVKQIIGSCDINVVDFCDICYTLFPPDEMIDRCVQQDCPGLRYKGGSSKQTLKRRKCYFACLPLEKQLQDILQRDRMWLTLQQYRRQTMKEDLLKDLICGEMYRKLAVPGNFLADENNISMLFNTDGVPLYSSSGVSIWPVYLVINELPPVMRFCKNNMILWGVWQAQGKPVFRTFFLPFIDQMVKLKTDGFKLDDITCRAILLAGTLDLQAKAMVAEMTAHNGMHGCLTCTEAGEVVKQGKGHCRSYPYRERPCDLRSSEGIMQNGVEATTSNTTVTGIKGVSCLFGMEWFDIVYGLVPDYMHGVLLGITKKLLKLMLSSNKKKPFFIGKHIKDIDKILIKMLPTDQISRLPRKLGKHLQHLKASELQNWLLFYSLPCLVPFLPSEYMNHFALFIEAIYILLGDGISSNSLQRSHDLLQLFYKNFENLYGQNNCSLNLHNVGHLVDYVRQLGPLWAWSCFPFEDMNGNLLNYVHGTGDVCQQILWRVQAEKKLAVDVVHMHDVRLKGFVEDMLSVGRCVKIKLRASDCNIAGGIRKFSLPYDLQQKVRRSLSIPIDGSIGILYKVLRIVIGENVFFSCQYTRLRKRNCHFVLTSSDSGMDMAAVQYFLYHEASDSCLAVVKKVVIDKSKPLLHPIVNHLIKITIDEQDSNMLVIPVRAIHEKLLYLNGNKECCCVARLPNMYGQCH